MLRKLLLIIILILGIAFLVNGAKAATITLTSPNGGETWTADLTYTISWTSSESLSYGIDLLDSNGSFYRQIAVDNSPTEFSWTVPDDIPSGEYKIRVYSPQPGVETTDPSYYDISDISDESFSIVAPDITITSPGSGEVLERSESFTITWKPQGLLPDSYGINLLKADGSFYKQIAVDNSPTEFSWTVSDDIPSGQYKIEVYSPRPGAATTDSNYKKAYDISDKFSIKGIGVTVTLPNGGETWKAGMSYRVVWESEDTDKVWIVISCEDYELGPWYNVSSVAGSGTYLFTIGEKQPSQSWCRAIVADNNIKDVNDIKEGINGDHSDGYFSIAGTTEPIVIISSPGSNESWGAGSTHTITWTVKNLSSASYGIDLLKSNGSFYKQIAVDQTQTPFSWTIPDDIPSGQYKIRVYSPRAGMATTNSSYYDISDISGVLNITSPAPTQTQTISSQTLPEGSLVKLPNDPKIYIIENGKRKWIRTAEEFNQKGYQWSDVKETTSETINTYAEYKEAIAKLIRAANQAKVYKIIDNKKLWIPTAEAFDKMGNRWEDIENVSATEEQQYPRAKLVKLADNDNVYYLTEGGYKRLIPSAKVFNSYGNKWEDIVEIESADLDAYPDVTLIRAAGQEKVYELENGVKRWIKTVSAFNRLGFKWNNVAPVNTTEINAYEEGEAIE